MNRVLAILAAAILAAAVTMPALAGPPGRSGKPGNSRSIASAAPGELKVDLHDEAPYFEPKRLRVPTGGTVVWENHGPGLTHTILIVDGKGVVRSGPIAPHQKWTYTFSGSAVVKTSCEIHPYMYGIVIVGEPPGELIKSVTSAAETAIPGVETAAITEFPMPVPHAVPGILAVDRQDNIWVTLGGGGWANINHPPLNRFARMTIDGDITLYNTPTAESGPSGLLIDDADTVFITELMGGRIARFSPQTKTIEEFKIPTTPSWPTGLALGRNGALWFNETKGNRVGVLRTDATIEEYPLPTDGAHPTGMVIDHDGTVWIAERDAGKVARLRPGGGFVELGLPTRDAKPAGMAVDSKNRVWFAERAGNKIAVIERGAVKEFALPSPDSAPFFVLPDLDDNIWFTEVYGNRIGVLIPATGAIIEFGIPTRDAWPGGLAFDSQGNLWFTEQLGNKVAVLMNATATLAGAVQRAKPGGASNATTNAHHHDHQ
jgi:virginiamycin B lyase